MSILDYNKLAIFSFPRAGTKFLAKVIENFGYHRCGEWYDNYTSTIDNDIAIRLDKNEIIKNHQITRTAETNTRLMLDVMNRHTILPDKEKFVITIWYENITDFPFLLLNNPELYWLCPQRESFEQLISWMISFKNQNFDGIYVSKPITIDFTLFQFFYWKLRRVDLAQDWLIKNNRGTIIHFDDLISGSYNGFGKSYTVSSADEHQDIYSYVINIDEVRTWYSSLEEKFKLLT